MVVLPTMEAKKLTIGRIAEIVGGKVQGDPDLEIESVASMRAS